MLNEPKINKKGVIKNMPKGKCRKCGAIYHGWALLQKPDENVCIKCGGVVDVVKDPERRSLDDTLVIYQSVKN